MNPLILIMIDGLGADHFSCYQQQLPQLSALVARGMLIERLSPERSATSLPGRTSIVTGVPTALHGIYGNVIWDGIQFRYANSSDVKASTIAEQASSSGLSVANIGYGMVGPEHCNSYYPPIWAHEMLQSSSDGLYDDSNQVWESKLALAKNAGWIDGLKCGGGGCSPGLASRDYDTQPEYLLSGQLNDQIIIDWCAALTTEQNSPDLILTEIAMPDYYLHRYGCDSDFVQHSIKVADSQDGRLLDHLRLSGWLDNINIIVTSDHGFSNVKQTLHPDVILPQAKLSCEGGILYVHYESKQQLTEYAIALAEYQVLALDNHFLPADQRNHVAAFLASDNSDFHFDKAHTGEAIGNPHYRANHGFKPGHNADERFLFMAGTDIPVGRQAFAKAEQVAPTMAKLLKLSTNGYPLTPLF
jgi:predicted AlkP superfamily pyrophosphatase or phosphodiesterase